MEINVEDGQHISSAIEWSLMTLLKNRDIPRTNFKFKQGALDIDESLDYKIAPALHVDL